MMFLSLLCLFCLGTLAVPNCNSCQTQLNTLKSWTCTCSSTLSAPQWTTSGCPSSLTISSGVLQYTPAVGENGIHACTVSDGSGTQTLSLVVDSAFIRIACGSGTNVNDNGVYLSDRDFNSSATATFCVTDTNISPRRRCSRWLGALTVDLVYLIPVPNANFEVILEIVELYNEIKAAGERVFDAVVNSQTITNIDPFKIAGFEGDAFQTFSNVPVTNGIINIALKRRVQNPTINGIAIFPLSGSSGSPPAFTSTPPTVQAIPFSTWTYNPTASQSPTSWKLATSSVSSFVTVNANTGACQLRATNTQAGQTVSFGITATNTHGSTTQNIAVKVDSAFIRVHLGGTSNFVDSNGLTWQADTNQTFGLTFTNSSANPGNFPAALCQTQRFGQPGVDLVYRFTVPVPGNYLVNIVGCETWSGAMGVGKRVFNVLTQGFTAFSAVDLFAEGGTSAVTLPVSVPISSVSTPIVLKFTHQVQNPQIATIAISFAGGGTTTTCTAPFVSDGAGNCVNNANGCSAFNNQWDCARGCVDPSKSGVYNICQGGTCKNGVCVPGTVKATEVAAIRLFIESFLNGEETFEIATANLVGLQPGDTVGAVIRSAFHSTSTRVAEACLFVAPCTNCEFDNAHNEGLANIVLAMRNVYHAHSLWRNMTMTDFVYLFHAQAVVHASGGAINPTYTWGRVQCKCMTTFPLTSCPGGMTVTAVDAMPNGESTLAEIQAIFENATGGGMGYNSTEWRCLLGAHALGRAMPNNTGYARHWTNTPTVLDNSYAQTLTESTHWSPETGVANPGFTSPATGKTQYCVTGSPGSGRMMLKSDIRSFWEADGTNDNCILTHDGSGCPPLPELDLLNQMVSTPGTFEACFVSAFNKMITLRQTNLRAPA